MSETSFREPATSSKHGSRQSKSCKVCRVRKVKCDRVKPCHACCTHGYPSKCVYEITPGEDFRPISQADEIRNLRAEIRDLGLQLDNSSRSRRRLKQLHSVIQTIRSAPEEEVNRLIADIRGSRENQWDTTADPWEGMKSTASDLTDPDKPSGTLESEEDDSHCLLVQRSSRESSETSDDSAYGSICRMDSAKSMLDVFTERFVDAFSPEVDSNAGRAGAIRRAAEIRMFSPILTEAFQAVSQVFFGRSVQNKSIEVMGFSGYPRVLRSLQEALLDPERSKAESTLATVILLMAFESVERTSQASLSAHVQGAVRLIEHRGPENHMYGVEHLLFTELRPYWVSASFARRAPTFLARKEWKTIPWSAGTTAKNILHYLLDLAVEIPALLGQYDELQVGIDAQILSAHETSVKQAAFWNGVRDITNRLSLWKVNWVDGYPDGPPREVEATEDTQFPIFHCRDLRTGAIITPTKFQYPDLLLTQTMCIYYAARLILSSVDTRPTDGVSRQEQYELSCGICRSLEWYILMSPGNMINRLAFPVRVAWEAFPDRGPERKFLFQVLKLVEMRHSLGLWGGGMEDISPRYNSPPRSEVSSPPRELTPVEG
ncbi:Zn(II)2Cys6 transcription factor domain-containing protein [Aspergillus undulatus]|uniref:Zn(II)2Cys6 transcription factor domain-containing protein n=1 Tax=Aspergillus undulatus TaxID=1810928 RepID=UPI003CCD3F12